MGCFFSLSSYFGLPNKVIHLLQIFLILILKVISSKNERQLIFLFYGFYKVVEERSTHRTYKATVADCDIFFHMALLGTFSFLIILLLLLNSQRLTWLLIFLVFFLVYFPLYSIVNSIFPSLSLPPPPPPLSICLPTRYFICLSESDRRKYIKCNI